MGDCTGTVTAIDARTSVAEVDFHVGVLYGATVSVPIAYLTDAPKEKAPRRSPLTLSLPPDDRDEATRLAHGVRDLLRLGSGPGKTMQYSVLRVGQGSSAAICHKCSRESRQKGGSGIVRIRCKDCGSEGYAPSTNSTEGVPDTLVFRADWARGIALMCEWKDSPSGARTPEQKLLEAAGRIVVVWDTPSFFEAIYHFEQSIGVAHHPALQAFVERGASPLSRAE